MRHERNGDLMKRFAFLFAVLAVLLATELAAEIKSPVQKGVKKSEIRCEGVYPWHLQGVATDGRSIFWSFTTVLVKTGLDGSFIAKHEIDRSEGHMGDLCCHNGKVYVGMNMGQREWCRKGDEVWEYDIDSMKLLKKYPTPQTVWCNNGLEFHAGSFWVISSAPVHSRYNMVFRYTSDFRFMRCLMIDSGWTNLGVQTICFRKGKMLFGCYGNSKDEKFPHKSCTFVVDGKSLADMKGNGEFPHIVPCERRVEVGTSEGMLELDGTLMAGKSILLSPKEDKQNRRYTARLVPVEL
jgi:hypothetical protein